MIRYIFSCLSLFLCATYFQAQSLSVKAPTVVDRNEEFFRVQFVVGSSDARDFHGPSFSEFEVLSGPNVSTSSNFQMINGRTARSSSSTYTYLLAPRKTGTFTIGSAIVNLNGRTLRSKSFVIKVVSTGKNQSSISHLTQQPRSVASVQHVGTAITSKDLFITVVPNRRKVYEQEAVLLVYKVHCRSGVGLSNVMLTRKPDFQGLISQEIPVKSIQMSSESIGGRTYKTGIISQYVIFPQKTGTIAIPSLSFDCTIVQQEQFSDPLDAFFNNGMIGVKKTCQVPVTKIEVLPLPQPKPATFSGGVGKFKLSGRLLTNMPKSNDVATYRLTLSGIGNLKLIPAPKLVFPHDFDFYDAKTTYKTNVTAAGTSGDVYFDYTFVPHNVGKYELPAVNFVVFNPETHSYQTLHTDPLQLDVKKGTRSREDIQEELDLRNSDISPIKKGDATVVDIKNPFWVGSWQFYLEVLFILFLSIAFYRLMGVIVARGRDVEGSRRNRAGRSAFANLNKLAHQSLDNEVVFYGEILRILQTYLSAKYKISLSDFNTDSIRASLQRAHVDEALIQDLQTIIAVCETARFAPTSEASRQNILEQTFTMLRKFEGRKA